VRVLAVLVPAQALVLARAVLVAAPAAEGALSKSRAS
jgi:hypothetical protein